MHSAYCKHEDTRSGYCYECGTKLDEELLIEETAPPPVSRSPMASPQRLIVLRISPEQPAGIFTIGLLLSEDGSVTTHFIPHGDALHGPSIAAHLEHTLKIRINETIEPLPILTLTQSSFRNLTARLC